MIRGGEFDMKCINNATTCVFNKSGECMSSPKPKHIPGCGTVCMNIVTGSRGNVA